MCRQVRSDNEACYISEPGKSCPTEILEALASFNAEGRPIWKPMHMQPMYRMNPFVIRDGNGRGRTNAYIPGGCKDVGADIFERGLCLPSDIKMTEEEQICLLASDGMLVKRPLLVGENYVLVGFRQAEWDETVT